MNNLENKVEDILNSLSERAIKSIGKGFDDAFYELKTLLIVIRVSEYSKDDIVSIFEHEWNICEDYKIPKESPSFKEIKYIQDRIIDLFNRQEKRCVI